MFSEDSPLPISTIINIQYVYTSLNKKNENWKGKEKDYIKSDA